MNASAPKPNRIRRGLAGLGAAWLLVAGSGDRVARHDGSDSRGMWFWLGVIGWTWGLALAGVWALAVIVFQGNAGHNLPLMPVAMVTVAAALGPFRRTLFAPGQVWGERSSPAAQGAAAAVAVTVLVLGLLQIVPLGYREPVSLPAALAWVRPLEEYRVLILMPAWGAWAMMIPGHFCRPAAGAPQLVKRFGKRQPVAATAMWMAAALAGTLWYLSFLGRCVALPAAAALVVGSAGGIVLCRLRGGVCRAALLAGNLLTQLAFLLGYLAGKAHA